MTRSSVVVALVLSLSASLPVLAAPNAKAAALVKDGERLYKENKYKDAAEALKQAYAIEPSPVLLFNIARAYDQAGELQTALDFYRQFVGSEGAAPDLLKKANLNMERLRNLVAKGEAEDTVRAAEKKRLEEDARKAKEAAEAEAAKSKQQREAFDAKEKARADAQQSKTSGRTVAALVIGGVAVAALATGIGLGVASGGNKDAFLKATTVEDKRGFESATRTTALAADISFAVSIAAAVTAVLVFPKGGDAPADVSVSFAPIREGGVVGVGGSF